nr:NAD(P)H-hydrate dehydratase [uncultured Mediterraneibacter sp.]
MRYLPDGIQMKSADRYTIEQVGIPSLVLMERAALQTVSAMRRYGIDLSRPLIVCGSGNNGGDGFAIARLLYEGGREAEVFFAGKDSSLSEECRIQKKIVENLGIKVSTDYPAGEYTVIIDAIFGVGLSRDVAGRYCDIIGWMNKQKCRKAAVDIPSGICARTGRVLGTAFQAELTVGMTCVKIGCELYPGKKYAGYTEAVSIGIDPEIFSENHDVCVTSDTEDIPHMLPKRTQDSHKGSYGKVLMITGSSGMAGASYLSARAAYSVGAGLVRVYTDEANREVLQQLLPEAVISCYHSYDEKRLEELLNWADVVCIGCGLGESDLSWKILSHTLEYVSVPCIVDADGLNLLGREKNLLKQVKAPAILTPHMKEMSRLTGYSVAELKERRIDILREFTSEYPVVCALKDSRTAVLQEGKHPFLNLAGNNAMAKAGSGDVLAGVITGLKAQGMKAYESAVLGVFLHACGGDKARDAKGGYSVLARDLIDGIEECLINSQEKDLR